MCWAAERDLNTAHAVNMLTYTYANICVEGTDTQTHTGAHTHCRAKPINTLPQHKSYSEQSWNRRAYVDNHTWKLDEQERHLYILATTSDNISKWCWVIYPKHIYKHKNNNINTVFICQQ